MIPPNPPADGSCVNDIITLHKFRSRQLPFREVTMS